MPDEQAVAATSDEQAVAATEAAPQPKNLSQLLEERAAIEDQAHMLADPQAAIRAKEREILTAVSGQFAALEASVAALEDRATALEDRAAALEEHPALSIPALEQPSGQDAKTD